jgi:hypothetical protein
MSEVAVAMSASPPTVHRQGRGQYCSETGESEEPGASNLHLRFAQQAVAQLRRLLQAPHFPRAIHAFPHEKTKLWGGDVDTGHGRFV